MRITSVSYGFTKNLGNFQSQRMEVTVEVTEDPDKALELAVAFVCEALDLGLDEDQKTLLAEMRHPWIQVREG